MIKPLFQKVIVAYNGSNSSLRAVMYGILLAKQTDCQIKVVSVVDTASIKQLTLSKFMINDEASEIEEKLQQDCERNLQYVKELAKKKKIKIDTEIRKGAIWSEVVMSADEYGADLILLGGSTGGESYSNLKHDVVKSQDSEIIGSAHCSVMLVKYPFIEQLFKLS